MSDLSKVPSTDGKAAPEETARRLFEAGIAFAQGGEYGNAFSLYRRAYDMLACSPNRDDMAREQLQPLFATILTHAVGRIADIACEYMARPQGMGRADRQEYARQYVVDMNAADAMMERVVVCALFAQRMASSGEPLDPGDLARLQQGLSTLPIF